jgi:hypothetical protein
MLSPRRIILLSSICCFGIFCSIGIAKTLEEELYEVDQLRAGFDTPFDEVEKRCDELFKKYTEPEEQAKIYFELAQVEGQSGFQRPEKGIEYVKKALELPIDPLKKVRLYIYWGDAIQTANRGVNNQELVVARRKAALPYLDGLKETLQYNLPEKMPDLPRINAVRYIGPPDTEECYEIKRKNDEQVEAKEKAKFQRKMIQYRDVLVSQISSMYSRFPWASDEIRELATKILGDEVAVNRLMSAVDEAVQKRSEELEWAPMAPDNNHPMSSNQKNEASAKELPKDGIAELPICKDREIFIPKDSIALLEEKAFVLDLASGELLNPAARLDSKQVYNKFLKLGKGDIAWDGSLVTVRKAKALTVSKESNRPLKCVPGKWCNWDKFPEPIELPYSVLVVSNEDVDFLVTIHKIEAEGIRISYKKLNADEVGQYLLFEEEK